MEKTLRALSKLLDTVGMTIVYAILLLLVWLAIYAGMAFIFWTLTDPLNIIVDLKTC